MSRKIILEFFGQISYNALTMSCLFCKIVANEIPSSRVYEDEQVVVFKDIDPKAPIHYLVIPRSHIPTINDLTSEDTELVGHMVQTAKKIAIQQGFADNGYRLVFNVNDDGGQLIHHIHLHILGGRAMHWPPG